MIINNDVDLYSYNTMRLHSVANVLYTPLSKEELMEIIIKLIDDGLSYSLVAAGSNTIFAEQVNTPLVNMMEVDKRITFYDDGRVKVGCSVYIQVLIRRLQEQGLGGIEYLYSVPSSVGGAVYMNAGRGKTIGNAISDYLEEVEYFSPKQRRFCKYFKHADDFSYRHSPFQTNDAIIVSATFRFRQQAAKVTEKLIRDRMDYSKKFLSAEKPSCGSVFCEGNRLVYRLLMGQKCGGAMYSKKTPNWISNIRGATASDVMNLIKKGEKWHRWFYSKCKVELKYIE